MIANGNGRIEATSATPPPTTPTTSGECLGVPWESSHSSESSGNTGTVKRRPNSLDPKEKTPSPTECGVKISNPTERLVQDGKDVGKMEECENSTAVGGDGPPAPSSHTFVDRRKTISESKFSASKATKSEDSRLKSKLKPPSVLQRTSWGKVDQKSNTTMKSSAAGGGGGSREKKVSSPPGGPPDLGGGSGTRSQKKVSFIPSLSMNVSATSVASGGNVRTSAVKTILRTRVQQSQQEQLLTEGSSTVEYKELFRDYPLPAPPYRDPPPVPASTNTGTTLKRSDPKQISDEQQQIVPVEPTKTEDVSAVVRSKLKGFGLGKLISSHGGQERIKNTNNYVTLSPSPKTSGRVMSSKGAGELPAHPQPTAIASGGQPVGEKPRQPSPDDILAKPEFSSSLFKNIPVRQKKGTVPHLENYCLFDPSVDFFNEKEHKIRVIPESVELADQVLYQDHLIYDAVVDRDSDNYFTIEPESLEIEVKNRLSLERVEEKIDEIFNKTRTGSSSSSSRSGSSPDYPSMFNSVIETPSSNLESTDESDYGFRNRLMENLKVLAVPKSISDSIPDEGQEEGDGVLEEDAACGGDAAARTTMRQSPPSPSVYYGVVLKASSTVSHLERVHQQQSMSVPNSPLLQHRLQQQHQQAMKQLRKCDDSSSSSSSANVSPPAACIQNVGTNAGRSLMRQNTFTCTEGIASSSSASLQTQGTPKAINTSPSPPSLSGEEEKPPQQKVTKIKSETSTLGSGSGKVSNLLPLLRSTFALDPLKSSFSLPQLPTGSSANQHHRASATGAISKTQPPAVITSNGHQHRNGSLDSTPLFNRLRKRERPLSNHSDADSGFLSPATPPDSNGVTLLAVVTNEKMAKGGSLSSTSDAVVLEQCDSIQELIQVTIPCYFLFNVVFE
ncbi:hypothetical protein ZHAS_00007395 [Anopheles sinensis]|uniref:Uncharacterized protein n=1 Tax=Anopheles sinensis TaxID=74873 RepID=A0A084VPW1_ANOSI|nr:hypothetical protein ZHAS_00007395 [Anopheles sinensis]